MSFRRTAMCLCNCRHFSWRRRWSQSNIWRWKPTWFYWRFHWGNDEEGRQVFHSKENIFSNTYLFQIWRSLSSCYEGPNILILNCYLLALPRTTNRQRS